MPGAAAARRPGHPGAGGLVLPRGARRLPAVVEVALGRARSRCPAASRSTSSSRTRRRPPSTATEDRNGRRNHDEIRFWADYVSGGARRAYIYDDEGGTGGLGRGQDFVIAGDQNADPFDGDSVDDAILQLLDHPRIQDPHPTSAGAVEAAQRDGGANLTHTGPAAEDTADFADTAPGNLRADYVLPSERLAVLGSGVYWLTSATRCSRGWSARSRSRRATTAWSGSTYAPRVTRPERFAEGPADVHLTSTCRPLGAATRVRRVDRRRPDPGEPHVASPEPHPHAAPDGRPDPRQPQRGDLPPPLRRRLLQRRAQHHRDVVLPRRRRHGAEPPLRRRHRPHGRRADRAARRPARPPRRSRSAGHGRARQPGGLPFTPIAAAGHHRRRRDRAGRLPLGHDPALGRPDPRGRPDLRRRPPDARGAGRPVRLQQRLPRHHRDQPRRHHARCSCATTSTPTRTSCSRPAPRPRP